jgi:hypothetical protein
MLYISGGKDNGRYITNIFYQNLQFLNHVIIIKTKVLLPSPMSEGGEP